MVTLVPKLKSMAVFYNPCFPWYFWKFCVWCIHSSYHGCLLNRFWFPMNLGKFDGNLDFFFYLRWFCQTYSVHFFLCIRVCIHIVKIWNLNFSKIFFLTSPKSKMFWVPRWCHMQHSTADLMWSCSRG